MSKGNIETFFEWNYHIKEYYEGVVAHALPGHAVNINFTPSSTLVNDIDYIGIITAQSIPSSPNSVVSLYTVAYPNKGSPIYNSATPNPEWGNVQNVKNIQLNGKVHCATTDACGNIITGTNKEISVITEAGTTSHQILSLPYLVRVIPSENVEAYFCLENFDLITYDQGSDSVNVLLTLERTAVDLSIHPQDSREMLLAQGRKQILRFDRRERNPSSIRMDTGVTAVSYSPHHQLLYMVGFQHGGVGLFDMRYPTQPLSTSVAAETPAPGEHAVSSIVWSPHDPDIAAVASLDASVTLWSARPSPVLELPRVFVHRGHVASVSALSWCPDHRWTLASVSEDGLAEVWAIAPHVIEDFI